MRRVWRRGGWMGWEVDGDIGRGGLRRKSESFALALKRWPLRGEGGDYLGGDGFAAAYRVYAFVGFRFQVDFFGGDAESFRQGFTHFGEMRAELWALEDYYGIHVFDSEMLFVEEFAGVLEKLQAVRAFPFGVGVREMRADVAQT